MVAFIAGFTALGFILLIGFWIGVNVGSTSGRQASDWRFHDLIKERDDLQARLDRITSAIKNKG